MWQLCCPSMPTPHGHRGWRGLWPLALPQADVDMSWPGALWVDGNLAGGA